MDPVKKAKIERLQTNFGNLPVNKVPFASSLCQQFWRKNGTLSIKQFEWVDKLLELLDRPARPAPATSDGERIGDLQGILQLFRNAREHVKYPAIVLLTDLETVSRDKMIRLTVAGETARYPGTITITRFEKVGPRRPWLGYITADGVYKPEGRATTDEVSKIAMMLRMLAVDPAGVAREHGRLTGHCCFCMRPLEDERSTAVGYGPVCADHYHLPWGDRPAEFASAPAA